MGLGLAFIAGVLTILSPCVLPLLPMILASATAEHRYAPAARALGVGLSFAFFGGLLAWAGFAAGLHGAVFQTIAAVVLVANGVVLMAPRLQTRFTMAAGPFGNWANRTFGGRSNSGLTGQLALGLLLGAVWSPCVGPTLGAATLLAAHGKNPLSVTLTMLLFGLGTDLALAAIGLLSRSILLGWRDNMLGVGRWAKATMGAGLALVGVLMLTGLDKPIQSALVDASPLWLTRLTTLY